MRILRADPVRLSGAGWPAADQYEALIQDLTWCHFAVDERVLIGERIITTDCPLTNGIVRPFESANDLKSHLAGIAPRFVDDSKESSFKEYGDFPFLNADALRQKNSLADNFWTVTPARGMNSDFASLMNVAKQLKWTEKESSSKTNAQMKSAAGWATNYYQHCETWQDAYNRQLADWATNEWQDVGNGEHQSVYTAYANVSICRNWAPAFTNFYFQGYRIRAKPELYSAPTNRPCSADIYLVESHWRLDPSVFKDIDNLGIKDGYLWKAQSLPESSSDYRIGDYYGGTESPVKVSGMGAGPYSLEANDLIGLSYYIETMGYFRDEDIRLSHWLLKWNFAYK